MLENFKDPSNEYRPIPFWSWNDEIEPQELANQAGQMANAGLGGYFMHARSGLNVEYLGEKWFECIQAGIDSAKKTGLQAWAYDEEGWPSGFAGGLVPALSPDFHSKWMTFEKCMTDSGIDLQSAIAVFACDNGKYTLVSKQQAVGKTDFAWVKKHSSEYYVDTLNKRAIEAFLHCTHEKYYERFGSDFGTAMRGFFTDEPRLACNHFGELPWSDELPKAYRDMYGEEIYGVIPALFCNLPESDEARWRFYKLVNAMFVENYMKTIYDWCDAHNCEATGHIMMEESVFSQMTSTCGVMPFYEYLHMPGIDWLRRRIDSPVVPKQLGSAACQLGKSKAITETFALCGWNVSFEELKWIAEWQFINGVNHICQHLEAYSIRGERKRDYPPSLFTQQSWWSEYSRFNDYISRLSAALSEGAEMADVLLLHPMRSGFVAYDGTRTDEIKRLDDEFVSICGTLSGLHAGYHLGDETLIERHGSVDGDRFTIGKMSYSTVIMPRMYAIGARTLELLNEFLRAGGRAISVGELPRFTDGDNAMLERVNNTVKRSQPEKLAELGLSTVSVSQNEKEIACISCQRRDLGEAQLLFLVNHDQQNAFDANVAVFGICASAERLRAEDGESEPCVYESKENETIIKLRFEPMQSYIILLKKAEKPEKVLPDLAEGRSVRPGESWRVVRMEHNSLTLDACEFSVDGGEWQPKTPVILLQSQLLKLQRPCDVKMRFSFNIGENADFAELYAVIEDAQKYDIKLNGEQIIYADAGFFKDKSFKKVDIKSFAKIGKNTLELAVRFEQRQKVYDVLFGKNVYETEKNKLTYDIELESVYLLGDFGVSFDKTPAEGLRGTIATDGGFTITRRPETLKTGSFTEQGLAFFAQSLTISQKIQIEKHEGERLILRLGKQYAPLINVYLNKQLVKASLWAPYSADITKFALNGENELELELFASNRNLLGPHHHVNGECYNVGPESFRGVWSWVERASEADATDIADRTKSYWTDDYCFVKFGIGG